MSFLLLEGTAIPYQTLLKINHAETEPIKTQS